jgi:hypothetical protein
MIRHARTLFTLPLPVLALPIAMIEHPFRAALMTLIGSPPLLASGPLAAHLTAIAMSAVAVGTDEKSGQAIRAQASPLQQYRFVRRHAGLQAVSSRWTPAPVRVSLDLV